MKLSALPLIFLTLFSFKAQSEQHSNHLNIKTNTQNSSPSTSAECTSIHFKSLKLCGSLQWILGPIAGHEVESSFSFFVTDENDLFANADLTLKVVPWMTMHGGHGHGTAPTKVSQLKDNTGQDIPGHYTVEHIYFMMPGAWTLKFQWYDSSQNLIEEVEFPVSVTVL